MGKIGSKVIPVAPISDSMGHDFVEQSSHISNDNSSSSSSNNNNNNNDATYTESDVEA